jgi:hypothetical protein
MSDDNTQDTNEPSLASAGSHGGAIGWVMFRNGKMVFDVVWTDRDEAEKYCLGAYSGTAEVVRVYRQPQPTLTDEERASVKNFLTVGRLYSHEAVAGVLRRLLGESK